MWTREQLIESYENQLRKVCEAYCPLMNFGKGSYVPNLVAYIEFARSEVEAVRNGREW